MPAQFHQAHGFLEAQTADALAQPLLRNEPLGGIGIRLGFVHLFAAHLELVAHRRSLIVTP